ncbi:hypothetical protein MP638_006048, partial [Amoeboaphelidium occidentale]
MPKHTRHNDSLWDHDDFNIALSYFTPKSVEAIIKSYSDTKSSGKDGIHVKVLKALIPVGICKHLSRLFSICLNYGYTPKAWNETITMPIPKANPEGKAITIDQCRPIGLTSMFRRIFESCLVNLLTLTNPISDKLKTNFGQGGFKRDSSTILQALVFHDMQLLHKGIQIFIDYEKAFDSGRPKKVNEHLRSKRVPEFLRSVMQSLYYGGCTQIVVNHHLTEKINQFNGFTQGGPSSPIAWNLYIDPLAKDLNGDIPSK